MLQPAGTGMLLSTIINLCNISFALKSTTAQLLKEAVCWNSGVWDGASAEVEFGAF